MDQPINKRALRILTDQFWSAKGWKRDSDRFTSSDDLAYAKAHGVMFDPVHMDHAQAVHAVCDLVGRLDRRTVSDAFLASLSSRRLDWRSPLGSYAVFQNFDPHDAHIPEKRCEICGFYTSRREHDFNVLNFERLKWGGIRHTDVVYAAMDLDLFLKNPAPVPSDVDIAIFRTVIEAIRKADGKATAANLQATFSNVLKSNKSERDGMVATLGFCDVLAGSTYPGFSDAFIPAVRRPLPNRRFVDMSYPACWWDARMGINETRLTEYFGHVL